MTSDSMAMFPQAVIHLVMKVSCDVMDQVLTNAVTFTTIPCVWMNVQVLSSQTQPMSVYVQLELLDTTVLRVS